MSFRVECQLNKKIGLPEFSSIGASLALSIEVDGSLDDPDRVDAKVAEVYAIVSRALDAELARQQSQQPARPASTVEPQRRPSDRQDDDLAEYRRKEEPARNGDGYYDGRKSRDSFGTAAGPGRSGVATQPRREHQQRGGGDRRDDVPRTGKALYAWAKDHEETGTSGLIKAITNWGKQQGLGYKFQEWSRAEVGDAHTFACRWLAGDESDS